MNTLRSSILALLLVSFGLILMSTKSNPVRQSQVRIIVKRYYLHRVVTDRFLNIYVPKNYTRHKWHRERFKSLRALLRHTESNNNYMCLPNRDKCLGAYQFSEIAREQFGFNYFSTDSFAKNPLIFCAPEQEVMIMKMLRYSERQLRAYIKKYQGTVLADGTVVTKFGILAAAHLAGVGGVKKFFDEDYNPKDRNGSTIPKFMRLAMNCVTF